MNIQNEPPDWPKLYATLYEDFVPYATRMIKDDEDAEDIVADCISKLIIENKSIEGGLQGLKRYLYRTIINRCFNYLRDKKLHDKKHEEYYELQEKEVEELIQAESIKEERIAKVLNEIEQLSKPQKQAIKLKYFDELSYKQIADKMNLSIHTVSSHIDNAKKILRKKLTSYPFDCLIISPLIATFFFQTRLLLPW